MTQILFGYETSLIQCIKNAKMLMQAFIIIYLIDMYDFPSS